MIMSPSIDSAGLAHGKNFLTLHCFLTWNSNQSDKIYPPYSPDFDTKQVSHQPLIGLGLGSLLTPSKTSNPLFFFVFVFFFYPATTLNTGEPVFKRKPSGHLLAKSHRYIFTRKVRKAFSNNGYCFLRRMANLLIFIHNGGVWNVFIQPRLKNGTHFSCYESAPKSTIVK